MSSSGRSISEFNYTKNMKHLEEKEKEKEKEKKQEKNKKRALRRKMAYDKEQQNCRLLFIANCFEIITKRSLQTNGQLTEACLSNVPFLCQFLPRSCWSRPTDVAKSIELMYRVRECLVEAIAKCQFPFVVGRPNGTSTSFQCTYTGRTPNAEELSGFSVAVPLDRNYGEISTCEIACINKHDRLCYPAFATPDYDFGHDVICFDKEDLMKVFQSVLQLFGVH
jgi:hypothetical protein